MGHKRTFQFVLIVFSRKNIFSDMMLAHLEGAYNVQQPLPPLLIIKS